MATCMLTWNESWQRLFDLAASRVLKQPILKIDNSLESLHESQMMWFNFFYLDQLKNQFLVHFVKKNYNENGPIRKDIKKWTAKFCISTNLVNISPNFVCGNAKFGYMHTCMHSIRSISRRLMDKNACNLGISRFRSNQN